MERANNELQCSSIAIPAISSGIFRFPLDLCASVILEAIEAAASSFRQVCLTDIRIVIVDDPTYKAFRKVFLAKFPGAFNAFPTCSHHLGISRPKPSKLYNDALRLAEAERKALADAKAARNFKGYDANLVPCEFCKRSVNFDSYKLHLDFECHATEKSVINCRNCGLKILESVLH